MDCLNSSENSLGNDWGDSVNLKVFQMGNVRT